MSVRTPKYRLHKPSGQALVEINGQRTYLGKYGTEESKEHYKRILVENLRTEIRQVPSTLSTTNCDLTVNEVLLRYWQFAQTYYVKNGQPTDEQYGIRAALRSLRQLYGHTPARNFGPSGFGLLPRI